MKRRKKWLQVVDVSEWGKLAARLHAACPDKHDELLVALREIVDTNETLASDPIGHEARWDGRENGAA